MRWFTTTTVPSTARRQQLPLLALTAVTLAVFAGAAFPLTATPTADSATFPASVAYQGTALDAAGAPLTGLYPMTFRYFDRAGTELLTETIDAVQVDGGSFQVDLGTGTALAGGTYGTLQALFAEQPELELEVTVNGVRYEPRIGILPAGHSLKSRLVAAGLRSNDDKEVQWKHYEDRNGATALQSTILAPLGTRPQSEPVTGSIWRRPFELPVIGPFLSQPVRSLPIVEQKPMPEEDPAEINRPRHGNLFDEQGNRFGTIAPEVEDELAGLVLYTETTPPISVQFDGINNISGVLPPDIEAAVGPSHYLQVVNSVFAIYDKTGMLLAGPSATNSLWAGFGGPCQSFNNGDAIFLYDNLADRWVLTQFAVSGGNQSVCFAVSQTADPTGSYFLYRFVTPRFPDYYKLGVWPAANNNAYYMSTNSGFANQYDAFAIDRANMLAGTAARPIQFFQSFRNLLMPADLDGSTGPAADAPGLFYTFRNGSEPYFGNPPTDSLDVYEFDVDWDTPANSTMTLVESITPADGLADFNWTVCGFFVQNCIPQPGTAVGIDSQSWWPMQRLVYRNFGDHEALVGTWTVEVDPMGNRAAPRWFELRNTGGGWSIFQQGTHSPDAIHRWTPSIAMDGAGNIAIGYNRGDGSNFASIYYAVREAGDPLNMLQNEALMFAGTGAQTHSAARWGDYSSMELDPADDCTFWYTNEYLAVTGSSPWRTRIGAFSIPGCDAANDIFSDGFESGDISAWSSSVP